MDLHSRIFADCVIDVAVDDATVDMQSLIERLILFDKYILASRRLKEFKQIASTFGYAAAMELLKSGLLDIYCDAVMIGSSSHANIGDDPNPKQLPPGSFYLPLVSISQQEQFISYGMTELATTPGLKFKQLVKLKGAIADCILSRKENMGREALLQLAADLQRQDDLIVAALVAVLSKQLGKNISPKEIMLRLELVPHEVIQTHSNLISHFDLDEVVAHKAIEKALLAAGSLNMTIECMKTYSAVGTFREDELPFLDARLQFLISAVDAKGRTEQFRRIAAITDMPDLGAACAAGAIRFEKVIEIAQSDDCKRFREWLRSTDKMTDTEIREAFGSIRSKLERLVSGTTGKSIRWALGTAAGLIPGSGIVLGPAAGLFDTFLLEKVLPKPGPISFLNSKYPSIFDQQKM